MLDISCFDKPQSCRNRCRAVPCVKCIAPAFLSLGEAAHTAKLTQGIKAVAPSGQKLVRIGLMSHIPDNLILRQIQHQMKCHGKLNRTQIRTQMATVFTDLFNQEGSDLLRQLLIVLRINFFDIIFFLYFIQNHCNHQLTASCY